MASGSGEYLYDTNDFREGAFRFGGQITYDHLRKQYYRDDISYFLCRGLIEESIGKGFEIVDPDGEILDINEDLQQILPVYMPEIVRALSLERRDGRMLTAFMEEEGKLYFRSFTQDFYKIKYNKFGDIERAEATSTILGYPGVVPHTFEAKTLEGIRELMFRRREKINSGMSYLEPIWDIIIGLYFVASHIAYHVARAGAGIKSFEIERDESVPVDALTEDEINDLIERATNFGSQSDVLVTPPGVKLNESLLNSASGIRWNEIFEILLTRCCIYSGVPMTRLRGIVPGQLEGAAVNEESYFDVLRDIQEQVRPFIKWVVLKIGTFYGFLDENTEFDILFNVREEMSENDQILLDMKKLDLAKKYLDLGVKKEIAFEKAGLEITTADLDEEEIQKKEDEREAFLTGKMQQSDNE